MNSYYLKQLKYNFFIAVFLKDAISNCSLEIVH